MPRGDPAMIVAVKYENGSPFLSIEEIRIERKTYTVEFKELSLDELKVQLRRLDQ